MTTLNTKAIRERADWQHHEQVAERLVRQRAADWPTDPRAPLVIGQTKDRDMYLSRVNAMALVRIIDSARCACPGCGCSEEDCRPLWPQQRKCCPDCDHDSAKRLREERDSSRAEAAQLRQEREMLRIVLQELVDRRAKAVKTYGGSKDGGDGRYARARAALSSLAATETKT